MPRDCAALDLTCRVTSSGPSCVCADAPLSCAPDGRAVEGCMDGIPSVRYCDVGGCAAGACVNDCIVADITPGTHTIDLCSMGGDNRNETTAECMAEANGEDAQRRLVLTTRSRVTVTLRDADSAADVDTVLYLRGLCTTRSSQIACDDDVPCDEASPGLGPCNGASQLRESRVTADLERGVYFIVADSLSYDRSGTRWRCGTVELVVDVMPL